MRTSAPGSSRNVTRRPSPGRPPVMAGGAMPPPGRPAARPLRWSLWARRARGFTLIELLVVIAIVALTAGLASLALRDSAADRLEREALRLAALLEAARAESRATGLAVWWVPATDGASGEPGDGGFRFVGLPPSSTLPQRWLDPEVRAEVVGPPQVALGPDALIGPQRIVLRLGSHRLALATDGLGPFAVAPDAEAPDGAGPT